MVKWGIMMTIRDNSDCIVVSNDDLNIDHKITYEFWDRMERLLGRNIYMAEIIKIGKRMDELEKKGN